MKMIPLSAWVSLSVGALLIGLEYIAAAVVTAASNISPLLSFASPLLLAALSVPPLIVSDPASEPLRRFRGDPRSDVWQMRSEPGSDPN